MRILTKIRKMVQSFKKVDHKKRFRKQYRDVVQQKVDLQKKDLQLSLGQKW